MRHREVTPGQFGHVVTSHRNSEGELATLEQLADDHPRFPGGLLLCFYDENSSVVAPMLLDEGTVHWLGVATAVPATGDHDE